MTRRSERYHVIVNTSNVEQGDVVSVFSRRVDAVRRAKQICSSWDSAIKVQAIDTCAVLADKVIYAWSRYSNAQVEAAIAAEATAWSKFFHNHDADGIEARKQLHRANIKVSNFFTSDLLRCLQEQAKQEPTDLYVGLRANILAEVGEHNDIYQGKYLICPTGEPQFDCEGAANINELRAVVEQYREHYPTIRVCYV